MLDEIIVTDVWIVFSDETNPPKPIARHGSRWRWFSSRPKRGATSCLTSALTTAKPRLASPALAGADTFVFRGLEFAAVQVFPQVLVLPAGAIGQLREHAVMPPLDVGQGIANRFTEGRVRRDVGAIKVELDHGLAVVDGLEMAHRIHRGSSAGNIGREFHDARRLS